MENIKLKVKLTEEGINYLKEKFKKDYQNNNSMYPSNEEVDSEEFEVKVDENGYSELDLVTVSKLYNNENDLLEDEDIIVKLNERGKSIIKVKYYDDYVFTHDTIPSDDLVNSEEFEVKVDENGYSNFKLYDFLDIFGSFADLDVCDEIKIKEKEIIK